MELPEEKQREYAKRILLARMRLLQKHGFYGLLLMHLQFSLDPDCATAATDGVRMFFGPDFLDTISDDELEFVMMHEILHVALAHCFRARDLDHERFNIACDIVVNSNIKHANGDDDATITLAEYGTMMHIAPDGREGYLCTAEEVYHMLEQEESKVGNAGDGKQDKENGKSGSQSGGNGQNDKSNGQGNAGGQNDQSASQGNRNGQGDKSSGQKGAQGDKGKRQNGAGGGSGSKHGTASGQGKRSAACGGKDNTTYGKAGQVCDHFDDHSIWGKAQADANLKDVWQHRVVDAVEVLSERDEIRGRGTVPVGAKRLVDALKKPQTDWRQVLAEFVQEEICDYSFSPPDRRFSDNPFFLPDFNEREQVLRDVYFFIDTSGSISRKMMTAAFSEIKGALDQFDGKLSGYLGFFDAKLYEPIPFVDEKELLGILPKGGGGTDFQVVFDYMKDVEEPPMCIIILTDGFAPFPDEAETMGVPVLWIVNNDTVTPPWGKLARIEMNAYRD